MDSWDGIVAVDRDMSSLVDRSHTDKIQELENHIDILHTKLSAAEERIAILESIVLKTA